MDKYKAFTINIFPFNSDIVSGVLWNLPIEGLTEESPLLVVYSKASKGLTTKIIEDELENLVSQNLLENYSVSEKIEEQKNWNEVWENNLNVIHIGKNIVVKPTFRNYDKAENEIVIRLDPKMSFGTGEHSTTKLCVEILENTINTGDAVLDLGSGTAVLSIAAAMLGAGKVIAVDNDEWCLLNGKENIQLNNVQGIVKVRQGTINDVIENNFELVVANINKNVLIQSAQSISDKIKKAGKLILSGFYKSDTLELTKAFENYNLSSVSQYSKEDWSAILLRKKY